MESQALAGVLLVFAVYLSVKLALRTVRNTVSTVWRLAKYGLILYLVLWAWLAFMGDSTVGGSKGSLALVQQLVQASGSLLVGSMVGGGQTSSLLSLVQQLADSAQPKARRRSPQRKARRKMRQSSRSIEEGIADIADTFGLGDLLHQFSPDGPLFKDEPAFPRT